MFKILRSDEYVVMVQLLWIIKLEISTPKRHVTSNAGEFAFHLFLQAIEGYSLSVINYGSGYDKAPYEIAVLCGGGVYYRTPLTNDVITYKKWYHIVLYYLWLNLWVFIQAPDLDYFYSKLEELC